MKILLVHNFYGSLAPSGENQVFEAERELLLNGGCVVESFTRHSDEIRQIRFVGNVIGALATPWNPWTYVAIRREVQRFQPDVVHVHNTFPLLSPAVFHAVGKGAAVVLTLHNYRLFCPAAVPMRGGRVCTVCLDRQTAWPSVKYGCYRNSRWATLPLALSVALHRKLGTWSAKIDAFIALSDFQRRKVIAAGLPAAHVHVKPNFYPANPKVIPWQNRRQCVVFAGRLTAEKGVEALVRAWLLWGAEAPELRVVGDGAKREELERLAATNPRVPISFLGQLANEAARDEISNGRLLVLPSQCFEGFPMVVQEAFAFGTPAAISDIGPLPSIVKQGESGVVFAPADPSSLLRVVRRAWEKPGMLEALGKGARAEFESRYTKEKNFEMLMSVYEQAIITARGKSAIP